jgi:glutamate-5-semialdehyde dehydrogenase
MGNQEITNQLAHIKVAQRSLGALPARERTAMLYAIADTLEQQAQAIEAANQEDLDRAVQESLSAPLQKRLVCMIDKVQDICKGVREVASLTDPIGRVRERRELDTGLLLERVDVPIGVIGMIFESRPDALVQIISLCLKSGNAIVLKGGKEALHTNRMLVTVIREALKPFAVGSAWIVHLESREDVHMLLGLDEVIDLLIPRGSNEFVRYIMDHTRIPVLGHADGICALYIDESADIPMAVDIAIDAKCQYPAVCNAIETLLVHKKVAPQFLVQFKEAAIPWSLTIHGDDQVQNYINCVPAATSDWDTEYLGYEIAIKVVSSLEEAMDHIAEHGSGHTDAIVTEDIIRARTFMREVDSADVFWNCSTRFADGNRFGLGAEVGVSTQKIHARGPVGLDGLVIGKWLLAGNGHCVAPYAEGKPFTHVDLSSEGPALFDGDRT